tara:strand:+ start:14711 stop:15073 length:363 start_codon:yes stop_codon:yes gene_type:complete
MHLLEKMSNTLVKSSSSECIANFEQRLADASGPVIVDFTGAYCGPCKLLIPLLADLAADYQGAVEVWTIDIEQQQELAQHYGVRSVPTLLAFRGTLVQAQQVGFSGPHKVREMFADLAKK